MQLLASEPLIHCLLWFECSPQKPKHRSSRDLALLESLKMKMIKRQPVEPIGSR